MPELPEVETMVRGIRSHAEGQRIAAFEACPCSCRPLTIRPGLDQIATLVAGTTIVDVTRRAKRVVLKLSSGWAFVIEPRMTGLMLVSDPPDEGHLRVVWKLGTGKRQRSLWFWDRRGLGTISLLNPDQLARLFSDADLGREALEADAELWSRICQATVRPIKVLMLDQSKIAGIGNLYASEILHQARVHPETPAAELRRPQIQRIAQATLEILQTAIRYEGSTLSDGTYRNALNQSGGYQNAHRVYDREGEICPSCKKAQVIRIVQAQRSTFYCPKCQKRR
jgi:formamidopyrimidine-DNA glycosylase